MLQSVELTPLIQTTPSLPASRCSRVKQDTLPTLSLIAYVSVLLSGVGLALAEGVTQINNDLSDVTAVRYGFSIGFFASLGGAIGTNLAACAVTGVSALREQCVNGKEAAMRKIGKSAKPGGLIYQTFRGLPSYMYRTRS